MVLDIMRNASSTLFVVALIGFFLAVSNSEVVGGAAERCRGRHRWRYFPRDRNATDFFLQLLCRDPQCTNCESNVLPQHSCLVSCDSSAIVDCIPPSSIRITQFFLTNNCQGPKMESVEPANVCGMDNTDTFVKNVCPNSTEQRRWKDIYAKRPPELGFVSRRHKIP